MDNNGFSFQKSTAQTSGSKSWHSNNHEDSRNYQKQSQVLEEEETYVLMKSKKSLSTAAQEFFTKLEEARQEQPHKPPTTAHPPTAPTSPKLEVKTASTPKAPKASPVPSNRTPTPDSHQTQAANDRTDLGGSRDKLSLLACNLINKHERLRTLSKDDRRETLAKLIDEEKLYKVWLKKAKDGSVSKDEVKAEIARKGPRREQIDTLEWLLFPKRNKGVAIAGALVAGVDMTLRAVLDFYKEKFEGELQSASTSKFTAVDELERQLCSLENKEREWSQWFLNNVLSTSQLGDQQVTKNILEQSLDTQLKRKEKMISMSNELKKMKADVNSKVIAMKKSNAN